MTGSLAPEAVAPKLRGRFGKPYLYEQMCKSTQLLLLGSSLGEGAVAVTDEQTGGRGRLGRRWETPPGTALLVSVLLHPPPERHLPELSDGSVVIGIGINVDQSRDELPLDAPTKAGSLRTVTGRSTDRAELLVSLLFRLERIYDGWRHGGLADLYGEIGARDFLRGREITVDGEPALALQILRDGRLEIETHAGAVRALESGEIRYAA